MIITGAALALASFAIAAEQESKERDKSTGNAASQYMILTPGEIHWVEAAGGMPSGAKVAMLEGNPDKKGPFTIRLQVPAGYKILPHTHPAAEKWTVMSGSVFLGIGEKFDESAGKELTAGSFCVMSAGVPHFAWGKSDAVIEVHGTGPFQTKYINPSDAPHQAKQ